ncbi:hypothetical protein DVS28_a0796 [Euzebya pacifica]|uniref:Uncharacterized protein n=1 Tax=Euzebya pacifica TaxID=1608957 RepID=A0A346XTF0_9ACTN|nr:hypothetical protein DVS28_a0796 [Euzebya pacifica]
MLLGVGAHGPKCGRRVTVGPTRGCVGRPPPSAPHPGLADRRQ